MTYATPNEAQAEALALLNEAGIDPTILPEDGFDEEGYFEIERGADGKTVFNPDSTPRLSWREWPEGFPVEQFLSAATHWVILRRWQS